MTGKPKRAVITHLHSDHTVGLPDVIFTSWVMERTKPFALYGPPGIERMVTSIAEAWTEDIQIRTTGAERNSPDGWRVNVTEVIRTSALAIRRRSELLGPLAEPGRLRAARGAMVY